MLRVQNDEGQGVISLNLKRDNRDFKVKWLFSLNKYNEIGETGDKHWKKSRFKYQRRRRLGVPIVIIIDGSMIFMLALDKIYLRNKKDR